MSYYLVLRGPPAVGKTSIADSLRSTLKGKTVHIDIDQLRMMPYRSRGSTEERHLANKNAIYLCKNFVDAGYKVILEELFYEKELIDEIEQTLPNLGYKHKIFLINASLETCLTRNKGREYELKDEQVERLYTRVISLKIPGEIVISTDNKRVEEIVEEILSYLPKK